MIYEMFLEALSVRQRRAAVCGLSPVYAATKVTAAPKLK